MSDPEAAMSYLSDHVDPTRLPVYHAVGDEASAP
jgi:hypothetical protein